MNQENPVLLMICILTFKPDYMAATPQKFLHLHEHCLLSAHVTPSVEKTQRGILIKAGRNLVSFIHADDELRKTDIFKSVVNVIKS